MSGATRYKTFTLTEDGKRARVEYRGRRFYVHSHIEETKPIILPAAAMKLLVEKLPSFQKRMDNIGDEEEDQEYKRVHLNTSRIFHSFMTLSTYAHDPFIWLKVQFDTDDRDNPGTMVNRTCRGGTILNDVDPVELEKFVSECTGNK